MMQAVVTSRRIEASELRDLSLQSQNAIDVFMEDSQKLHNPEQSTDTKITDRAFAARLLLNIGENVYGMWFNQQTRFVQVGNEFFIDVASDFVADCIRKFCMPELTLTCHEIYGDEVALRIRAVAQSSADKVKSISNVHSSKEAKNGILATKNPNPVSSRATYDYSLTQANSHPKALSADFDGSTTRACQIERTVSKATPTHISEAARLPTFFVGKSNRLAATAVDLIVERPGELGVLYVYGPNGVGKTHLCKSIRERLRARYGMRRLVYMTAEQFTIDFSESTRGAGFAAFRKKYRDVDGLIIDDFSFFLTGNKQSTLAELRNTVDELLTRNRQVVMTADRPLSDFSVIGNDLVARLSGGVLCCLDSMDVELRRELLADICKRHNVMLHEATIQALSERATGDGRSLYGLVFRLMTEQRLTGKLTHEQALSCTLGLLNASQPIVRLSDIERVVCDSFGLDSNALKAKSRCKNVTSARMLAMYLARKHTSSAFSEIGHHFGNRQHSTVISAQKRVESWLAQDNPVSHPSGTVRVRDWIKNVETSLRVG